MRGETIQTHLDNGQVITMVVETFKLMTDLKKLTVAMNELTDLPPDVRGRLAASSAVLVFTWLRSPVVTRGLSLPNAFDPFSWPLITFLQRCRSGMSN